MKTIIRSCRLIPELSDNFKGGLADVLIENGTITEIASSISAHADEEVMADGKTLLPGLFDLHNHLNWDYTNGTDRLLNDFKILTNSCLSARRFLDLGVTTIRDMGSPKRVSVYVRDAIRKGLFLGPRIISGGMILRPRNHQADASEYHFLRYVCGADEVARAAREEIGEGADWVKIYVNGNPPDFLPEEMDAAVRIASVFHKKVAAHCHDAVGINQCIDHGVGTVEHASYVDAAAIEKLKHCDTYLVPTVSTLAPEITPSGFTPQMIEAYIKPLLDANIKNIPEAYKAGLTLGFGTDTPVEQLLQHPGIEFRMRSEYLHMDNIGILLQATKNSAKIVGLEGVTGEIKEGLCADLILVDGNPDEDISVMYHAPRLVFVRGTRYIPQQ